MIARMSSHQWGLMSATFREKFPAPKKESIRAMDNKDSDIIQP